jgi:hypothetical protein
MNNQNFDPQDKVTFEMSLEIDRLKKELDEVWNMMHVETEKNTKLESDQEKIIQFYEETEFALKEKLVEVSRLTDMLFNALCVARAYMPANYHSTVNETEGKDVATVNYAINAYCALKV